MRPTQLRPDHFASYPPLARQVATRQIRLLRQLPLSFVALLLREVIAYDWKFPAERTELDAQFTYLSSLRPDRLRQVMARFERLTLSPALENTDWVGSPKNFSEQLSAHLWATDQIPVFRAAAIELIEAVRAAVPQPAPETPRLAVVVLGQGVTQNSYRLFRKLLPHGTYFTDVNPEYGVASIVDRMATRARAHPIPFAHWYVDGGLPDTTRSGDLSLISYAQLEPLRAAVVARIRNMLGAGQGTEARRTALAQLLPEDVGLKHAGEKEAVMNHFKVSLLSEGSGGQFFSTTFVQWSAREILRRAQPLTLLARFAPRMTEHSMNEALMGLRASPVFDPQGSLIDADMAAYYTWLNLTRLGGASSFMVWFENHSEALVVSPSLPRGVESSGRVGVRELLDKAAP